MTYTGRIYLVRGMADIYAVKRPYSGTWSSIAQDMTAGTANEYTLANCEDGASYGVFQQASSGTYAETDTPLGEFSNVFVEMQAKTDLIGTGLAGISAPVAADGTISEIIIGDDYKDLNGRRFVWTFADPGNVSDGNACYFAAQSKSSATQRFQVAGTIVDVGSGNYEARIELSASDTAGLTSGDYNWSVEVEDDESTPNRITPVRSRTTTVALVNKQVQN